jgi:hypothetical protein
MGRALAVVAQVEHEHVIPFVVQCMGQPQQFYGRRARQIGQHIVGRVPQAVPGPTVEQDDGGVAAGGARRGDEPARQADAVAGRKVDVLERQAHVARCAPERLARRGDHPPGEEGHYRRRQSGGQPGQQAQESHYSSKGHGVLVVSCQLSVSSWQ